MNTEEFWIRIWKIIATVVGLAIVSISGCVAYESTLVTEMVAKGASPMAARCAIGVPSNYAVLCLERK